MDIGEIFKIALLALKVNKTRSFLTMLGIIVGVAAVILLVSIGSGLERYITGQLEDLGANLVMVIPGHIEIQPGGGGGGGMPGAGAAAPKFTLEMGKTLEARGRTIKKVMAYTESNAVMKYRDNTHITQASGVTNEYPEIRDQKVEKGRFFSSSAYQGGKKEVVLGKTVVEELFGENEDPVGKRIKISDQSFLVIGVLEEKGAIASADMDNQAFIPVTTAMRVFGLDNVQAFWVQSESADTVSETKKEIEEILERYLKKEDFSVLDTKSLLSAVGSILGAITLALGGIASISLVVGGIGIMNIMLVSVTERTKEIGLRKALGAPPKVILIQFLIEAVVLSLSGGVIGIFLGVIGSVLIGNFLKISITYWSIGVSFLVASMVGVIFGVAPAYKAAKLDPIEALRHE